MSAPKNAGQSITVQDIIRAPVTDIDFGEITVTENWGRLFIKKDNYQIVISQNAYRPLIEAIAQFTDVDLCDPPNDERVKVLVGLLKEARGDLEVYIENDWPAHTRETHPSIARKWHRDMELCRRIDNTLCALEQETDL